MSWATTLEVDYFNKKMNDRHNYRTEFFGDAQWKQAANTIEKIINENGPQNIYSIYLDKYCHWHLDDGTVLVPNECKCAECRPDLVKGKNDHPADRKISRSEAIKVLLIEKKNNPDFIKFVSA